MPRYKYKAINESGKYIKGKINASNQEDLEYLLKNSHLELISYQIEKNRVTLFEDSISTKDMITLFTHFEQLERAGVPIVESLLDIKDASTSSKVKNLMQEIYESVKNGSLLSEAMARHPKIFSSIFIGLIITGEKTGNLNTAFTSIIEHLKWSDAIKRKTVKAIRYPLFSLMVMMGVLWIMTSVVVPKVTAFLTVQDITLPKSTVLLIGFSAFMQNNTLYLIAAIPLIIITYKMMRGVPKIALKIDQIKLYIPIFGQIITKIEASRFCHFFSITFRSGIGVLDCLETAKEVVSNQAMRQGIELARSKVESGQSIAEAIAASGYFSSLVVRMFKIGEETGNMEKALENVRFFYDQEINDSIDKIVGMIQPGLIIIMGGMMAWITLAVFGPIYGTFANMTN
jgi:type IV pilus assembly protein PilC